MENLYSAKDCGIIKAQTPFDEKGAKYRMFRKFVAAFVAIMILLMLAPTSAFAAEPSVQEVEALIAQIGTVTRENRSAVERAVDAYSQLDDATKAEVSNFAVLAEAQQILGIKDSLSKLDVKHDKVEGDYMITSPYVFQEIDKGDCNVSPVVCVDDEDEMPWMVIMYHYTGDTFIWADSIVVRADENKYTYDSPAFYHSMRENAKISSGKVKSMEMLATLAEDFDIALLRDALSAEETIFRFKGHAPWGDSTQYDYILTAANRQEITDVLNAYDLMRSVSPEVLRKALA